MIFKSVCDLDPYYKKKLGALYLTLRLSDCYRPLKNVDPAAWDFFMKSVAHWDELWSYGFGNALQMGLLLLTEPTNSLEFQNLPGIPEQYKFPPETKNDHYTTSLWNLYVQEGADVLKTSDKERRFHYGYIGFLTLRINNVSKTGLELYELMRLDTPMDFINGQNVERSFNLLPGLLQGSELRKQIESGDMKGPVLSFADVNNYCLKWFKHTLLDTFNKLSDEKFCREYNHAHFEDYLANLLEKDETRPTPDIISIDEFNELLKSDLILRTQPSLSTDSRLDSVADNGSSDNEETGLDQLRPSSKSDKDMKSDLVTRKIKLDDQDLVEIHPYGPLKDVVKCQPNVENIHSFGFYRPYSSWIMKLIICSCLSLAVILIELYISFLIELVELEDSLDL